MRFTLKQLQYFIAAGETGGVTGAGERLNVSQSAISIAISQLEKELDAQLFIRHHAQGLSLTSAGRALLIEARRLIEQAEALYTVAAETTNDVRGQLSLGCFTTLAPMILPELSISFSASFPGVRIQPHAANQERLLAGLERGEIDLAITFDLQVPASVEFTPLASLPTHVILSENHPLAGRGSVRLSDLEEMPFILLDMPLSREYFLSIFMNEGVQPNIAFRFSEHEIVRTMVANGHGYSLVNAVPRSDLALDGRRIVHLRLSGDHNPIAIGLASLKQARKSRLVNAFIAHARSFISDAYIPGMIAPSRT